MNLNRGAMAQNSGGSMAHGMKITRSTTVFSLVGETIRVSVCQTFPLQVSPYTTAREEH